jgi:hypothetical protein
MRDLSITSIAGILTGLRIAGWATGGAGELLRGGGEGGLLVAPGDWAKMAPPEGPRRQRLMAPVEPRERGGTSASAEPRRAAHPGEKARTEQCDRVLSLRGTGWLLSPRRGVRSSPGHELFREANSRGACGGFYTFCRASETWRGETPASTHAALSVEGL